MCGIIGYVGQKDCVDIIIKGLSRLEYRGYDSSGIATLGVGKKTFEVYKAEGKLENIQKLIGYKDPYSISGKIGMGHTRWATHGKPNDINAHPHRVGQTVLVHNGIIENFEILKEEILAKGRQVVSETDSELFGHLVEEELATGLGFEESVRKSFLRLHGSCSIVVVNDRFPNTLIAIRNGTPLVAAFSEKSQGSLVASDAQAILEHTRKVTYLENEDMVISTEKGFDIYPVKKPLNKANIVRREPIELDWSPTSLDKDGFPHYMLKEIFEQPRAIIDTLDLLIDREDGIPRMQKLDAHLSRIKRIQLIACGTAWHAGLIGKYLLESELRIPVEVDLASEYRYRKPIVDKETLFLAISQSGETADTLAALKEAKAGGAIIAAICNVRGSTLSRDADISFFTAAGPEIGVASTKAFTTQVLTLMLLTQYLKNTLKKEKSDLNLNFYLKLPHMIQSILDTDSQIKSIAKTVLSSKGFLFIGRGRLFPIALEGALKTKEITYIHAEGYPAGELKHGPIAMVEPEMTVVVLAPRDDVYEKTVSNLQEVKARGGKILAIGDKSDESLKRVADYYLGYEFNHDWSDPLLAVIPLQLLAYHIAVFKGTDVDKPRNLAKSVTVE